MVGGGKGSWMARPKEPRAAACAGASPPGAPQHSHATEPAKRAHSSPVSPSASSSAAMRASRSASSRCRCSRRRWLLLCLLAFCAGGEGTRGGDVHNLLLAQSVARHAGQACSALPTAAAPCLERLPVLALLALLAAATAAEVHGVEGAGHRHRLCHRPLLGALQRRQLGGVPAGSAVGSSRRWVGERRALDDALLAGGAQLAELGSRAASDPAKPLPWGRGHIHGEQAPLRGVRRALLKGAAKLGGPPALVLLTACPSLPPAAAPHPSPSSPSSWPGP